MRTIRLLEEAVVEAMEAADWYEKARSGLGFEFEEALNAAFDLLGDDFAPLTPFPGRAGIRGLKRLTLSRFPFDILVYAGPSEILVVAVAHHAREPGYWRKRVHGVRMGHDPTRS